MPLDELARRLIQRYQHQLPICPEPWQVMATELGCSEADILDCLQRLDARGVLSRVGPVFEHSRVGASTLAALSVPPARLEQVAEQINRYPEVNHNYLREHHYNLWFVLTGPDQSTLQRCLEEIRQHTGLTPLDLPMRRAYHIDLGFALEATP